MSWRAIVAAVLASALFGGGGYVWSRMHARGYD
jgi:hypothetical protein